MGSLALPVLGPAQLWWGPHPFETELGKTFGGIRFFDTETETDIFYDQVGTAKWDAYITGVEVRVEADFANLSHGLMNDIMSGTQICQDGSTPTFCNLVLDRWSPVGLSKRDAAQGLIIKPYIGGIVSPNPCYWVHFPLAYPHVDMEWVYDSTTQRVIHTIFEIFPVSQSVPRLWYMGDETLLPDIMVDPACED